jgi:hypothetical protein
VGGALGLRHLLRVPRYQPAAAPVPHASFQCDPDCQQRRTHRGDVQAAPVAKDISNSNIERFISSRASLLVQPSDALSITGNFMYQRIDADGYNNYQAPPNNEAIYQPYDIKEPYYDSFHMWSLKVSYDMSFANLTSASSYWKRDVYQSTDSTEALQNIFNYTAFVPNLYMDNDLTWQIAQELRLTSRGEGDLQWVGGLYYSNLHSGYITKNQTPGFVNTPACPYGDGPAGHCPPAILRGREQRLLISGSIRHFEDSDLDHGPSANVGRRQDSHAAIKQPGGDKVGAVSRLQKGGFARDSIQGIIKGRIESGSGNDSLTGQGIGHRPSDQADVREID